MARDTVALIKDRLSIVEIVSPYVKISRAGKSLKGLCPFHKEKTPSFHVSIERGTYHCFGCGESGDGFSFIEKVEGVDFKGALKILAEKASVSLNHPQNEGREDGNRTRRERLRKTISRAAEWYASKLSDSPAETYAIQRGLLSKTIVSWRLGYAPPTWRALLEALTAEDFTVEELMMAGLVKEADGKPGTYYDRFRNRLLFPIRDGIGHVVAFTGRTLSVDESAKYLNSPETVLYHKSDILFGMDRAKDAIRTRDLTILVEGQIDVILAHQVGFENAVALSGTALSEKHIALMKRYSDNLLLILDADAAGLKASARAAVLALSHGLRVKAAQLPEGNDPADLINEDTKEFSHRIASARPIVEFFLSVLAEHETDPHQILSAAENVVLPLIAAMPSPMEREHFTQVAARSLGLSVEAVHESLKRLPRQGGTDSSMGKDLTIASTIRSSRDTRSQQLLAVFHAYPNTSLATRVKTEYLRITEVNQLPVEMPSESALFQAELTLGEEPSEHAVDELLHAFEEAVIREEYQEAVINLRRAETAGDASVIGRAQALCAKLSARLAAIGR